MNTSLYLSSIPLLSLVLSSSAFAITLDEALKQAITHNRQIQIVRINIEQRRQELAAQKTRRLPASSATLIAGISPTRADVTFPNGVLGVYPGTGPIPGTDLKVGIPRHFSGFAFSTVGLPLTQQIRIGAGIEVAGLELEVSKTSRTRTTLEVAAQVRRLYFGLLSADAAANAAQSTLGLASEVERLAGQAVAAGVTLQSDRGEAIARRLRAESALAAINAERENLREQFNQVLGRPLDEPIDLVRPDLPCTATPATPAAAANKAVASRPEIDTGRLRIRQAQIAARAKRAEQIPDISLAFMHFGFLNTGNLVPSNFAAAGLQLNWEPWDWGRRSKEAKALRYQADAARLALEEIVQQVRRQASQAFRAWEQTRTDLEAAEAAVAAAEASMRVVRRRFEQQAALMREVLEAQATFETAQEQRVRALSARGTAWANMQLALGEQ
ncbi:MAG: TolC family protein [Bryobacterales bacterium]|nr:TolC family protein [Bryobacterales bacterium]